MERPTVVNSRSAPRTEYPRRNVRVFWRMTFSPFWACKQTEQIPIRYVGAGILVGKIVGGVRVFDEGVVRE